MAGADGGDGGNLAAGLTDFLERHGLPTDLAAPGTDRRPAAAAAGRLEFGLTIRTVAADDRRLHVWAGGGSPGAATAEVAEAHAKAGPVLAAIEDGERLRPGEAAPRRG